jgi:hypothetical protein
VNTLSFLDLLKTVTARWYWLVTAMIIGGLLGWGVSTLKKPIYEANAVFTVTIDYTQTGALTDVEEDQAMRGVGDIIFSDEVVSATLAALQQEGLELSRDEFFDDAVFDREEFRWAIRYRDVNPEIALQVITAWQEQADRILKSSLEHARLAASYQRVLNGLEFCLQRSTQTSEALVDCSVENLDEVTTAISNASSLVETELAQSRGLFSALAVVLSDQGDLPVKPVRYQTNIQVLSGMVIGLLSAILILSIRFQVRKTSGNG